MIVACDNQIRSTQRKESLQSLLPRFIRRQQERTMPSILSNSKMSNRTVSRMRSESSHIASNSQFGVRKTKETKKPVQQKQKRTPSSPRQQRNNRGIRFFTSTYLLRKGLQSTLWFIRQSEVTDERVIVRDRWSREVTRMNPAQAFC